MPVLTQIECAAIKEWSMRMALFGGKCVYLQPTTLLQLRRLSFRFAMRGRGGFGAQAPP